MSKTIENLKALQEADKMIKESRARAIQAPFKALYNYALKPAYYLTTGLCKLTAKGISKTYDAATLITETVNKADAYERLYPSSKYSGSQIIKGVMKKVDNAREYSQLEAIAKKRNLESAEDAHKLLQKEAHEKKLKEEIDKAHAMFRLLRRRMGKTPTKANKNAYNLAVDAFNDKLTSEGVTDFNAYRNYI